MPSSSLTLMVGTAYWNVGSQLAPHSHKDLHKPSLWSLSLGLSPALLPQALPHAPVSPSGEQSHFHFPGFLLHPVILDSFQCWAHCPPLQDIPLPVSIPIGPQPPPKQVSISAPLAGHLSLWSSQVAPSLPILVSHLQLWWPPISLPYLPPPLSFLQPAPSPSSQNTLVHSFLRPLSWSLSCVPYIHTLQPGTATWNCHCVDIYTAFFAVWLLGGVWKMPDIQWCSKDNQL